MTNVLVAGLPRRAPRVVRHALACGDHDVEEAHGLDEILHALSNGSPDAVVLCLDGVAVTSVIRDVASRTSAPVIVIAPALIDEPSKVAALDAGASYCLAPPVGVAELQAWLRATQRRAMLAEHELVFSVGDAILDANMHRISLSDGSEAMLTPAQWRVVELLARHNGRVVSYAQLHAQLWGARTQRTASLLRSHLSSIRQRVERDPRDPRYFVTVRGVGIAFAPNGSGSP